MFLFASQLLACNEAQSIEVKFINLAGVTSVAELPMIDGAPALPNQGVLYDGYGIRFLPIETDHPAYTVLFKKPEVAVRHKTPDTDAMEIAWADFPPYDYNPSHTDFTMHGQLVVGEQVIPGNTVIIELNSSSPGCRAVLDRRFVELRVRIGEGSTPIPELIDKFFETLRITSSNSAIVGLYHQGVNKYSGFPDNPDQVAGISIKLNLDGIELWMKFRVDFQDMNHDSQNRSRMIDALASLGRGMSVLPGSFELDKETIAQGEIRTICMYYAFVHDYNTDSAVRIFRLQPASLPMFQGLMSKYLEDLAKIELGPPMPPYLLPLLGERLR